MADKALVCGINTYESVSGLRGCENDVHNMQRLLTETFGFPSQNVKILLNKQVVKSEVRSGMDWLFQDSRPGDRIVFHFSGHGSYTADLDGDEETDHVDELICLHDMDFNRPRTYFLDDELRRWTRRLPSGVQLTVFLDNCHSGSGTRKLIPPGDTRSVREHPWVIEKATAVRSAARSLRSLGGPEMLSRSAAGELASGLMQPAEEDKVIARFIEPPPEIEAKIQSLRQRGITRGGTMREVVASMNHILLSACRDNQTAADAFIDGQYNGAFTYHLCKILRASGPDLDRGELIQRLTKALSDAQFDQVPQLEGPSNTGPLFAKTTAPVTVSKPAESADSCVGSVGTFSAPSESPTITTGGVFGTMSGTSEAPTGTVTAVFGTQSGTSGSPSATVLETPAVPGITPPSSTGGFEGNGQRLFHELLATYNRLLDLVGPAKAKEFAAPEVRAVAGRFLVYVHGICRHDPGYSNDWWNALRPFAPSLQPGQLGGSRREVLWSDLVNVSRRLERGPGLAAPAMPAEHRELSQRLKDQLEDRMQQEFAAVAPESTRDATRAPEFSLARGALTIPGFNCVDDFTVYLIDGSVRSQVINRFNQVVLPLLTSGAQIDIISHSWGTVVAFEALRLLDRDSRLATGSVLNWFTVGSALSIPEIKRRLIPEAIDGRRPRLVRRWVNLDAQGDIVGGPLKGVPYQVDEEFLNLPPTGCSKFFGLINPTCAHSSYFNSANGTVNQGIFGKFIEG